MAFIAPADQRILAGSVGSLSMTLFDQNGEPDAGANTVTVGVTRGDGSEVLAPATATVAAGSVRTVALTRAQTAAVDRLSASWSIGGDVVATTTVDVVGAHWFGLSALRERKPLANLEVSKLVAARDGFADLADRVTGVSWVPRWWTETGTHHGGNVMVPAWPQVREIIAATLDGDALDLTDWYLDAEGGVIVAPGGVGRGELTLTYRHGFDRPPQPLVKAALQAAEWALVGDTSNVSPRTMSFSNDAGSFRYAVASDKYPTGLPEVDAVLAQFSRRVPGLA